MDQFVTTYRRDYLWPYIKSFGKKLIEPPVDTAGFNKKCICRCYPPSPAVHSHDALTPKFDETQKQDWSRIGPMGPLLDAKLYPVQVGKAPETNTMREDQPNQFLKKLRAKYPFLHEILQTAPTAEMYNKVNEDRLKSTYQIDYCHMEEYPPDSLLRTSGVGLGPCKEPNRIPGEPYRPDQSSKSFKKSLQTPKTKRVACVTGPGQGGTSGKAAAESGGGRDISRWVPGISEYQDGVSKIGAIIIKDQIHSHLRKRGH